MHRPLSTSLYAQLCPRSKPSKLNLLLRHASSTAKPVKARVLPQPDAFRPPSHPAKLRTSPKAYPGPPLSEHERQAQKTRQYPHMMPPEGSFMYTFLTSRWIHLWTTLSVLTSLTLFVVLTNFLSTTPYKLLLPPNDMFWSHPLHFLARWWEVYRMHTEYITAQTMAKREAKVDDVRKRAEYRKAHGISEEGFGGWTYKAESTTNVKRNDDLIEKTGDDVDGTVERKRVKKWLGIW